jgi:alkyl hydroperoxide reductase subunit AhpC
MSKVKLQQKAPFFKTAALVNGEFKELSLDDYKGWANRLMLGKYLVLFFYPLDFTFVCPTEIIAFSEKAAEFKKIGCEVVQPTHHRLSAAPSIQSFLTINGLKCLESKAALVK